MAFISLIEIWRILVMSLGIGFIFSFLIQKKPDSEDVVDKFRSRYSSRFHLDGDNILYATAIAAPGVILHELAHKFTAISFGLEATFYAAYLFLGIAILLILIGFPLVFFVPGYVSIIGNGTPLEYALIAFAGPLFNLVVFGVSWYVVRNSRKFKLSKNALYAWGVSKKINLFLFVFNLLPIPGFDGWSVYSNLWHVFF